MTTLYTSLGRNLPPKKKPIGIERSLEELQAIVEALEAGNISLEDSLKSFERGVKITRECQDALLNARQRVTKLAQQLLHDGPPEGIIEEEHESIDHSSEP